MSSNPLVAPWTGAFGGMPPWDRLSPELFPDAFRVAIAEQRSEIDAIVNNQEPATFENTVEALDRSGQARDRVERLFAVARESITTPAYQALEREWQPALAAANDAVFLRPELFQRLDAVRSSPHFDALAADQRRLTTYVHDLFVRRGARLDPAQKEALARLNQDLASLYAEFRQKVMADENTWTVLTGEADLAGLPPSLVNSARAAAEERALAGRWAIVNTRSSVEPFLTFSTRRDLRRQVWQKFKRRGDNGDDNDTNATITRIVKLRADRARLLGYPSHAHWRMSDTMAKDPARAQALLMQVWRAALAQVNDDIADMRAVAAREDPGASIEPWDYLYYAEKIRKARYDLDEADLEPYFELNRMVGAMLWAAAERYDLSFEEITGTVPVFHPDVRVWEVRDAGTGAHRGLFYLDNFARPGKRSGAWMSSYRLQKTAAPAATPITSNNNNFVKGAAGEPVLISLADARTLFHEFGHALHYLLQEIRYRTLSVTPRDFVELPSQVNESWVLTRELLDRFARHCETGHPMPQALVEKVERARAFNQGFATVEMVSAAILDMELHTRPEGEFDPSSFERDSLARMGMPREIALRHRLPHFDHLFGSDAYSAGYYSYVWADVMAADAWQAFLEAGGPWDKDVARRFRTHILSDGNVTDREEAYRAFRGRGPDPAALLEQRGFRAQDPSPA